VEKSEAELRERIKALEACEDDLKQRLADRDQAHAYIQSKLQVSLTLPESYWIIPTNANSIINAYIYIRALM
jgi:hypothetical protein